MTEPAEQSTADRILAAAAELFAKNPYRQVGIRDIAARAGVSPAMVMKCAGSKIDLFYRVATVSPLPLPDVPRAELGEALVARLLERAAREAIEPLNRALMLRVAGPDPDAVREQFTAAYLEPLTQRLGGDGEARLRAELAIAALTGLAATYRLFDLTAAREVPAEVARRYAAVVQALIDGV